MGLFNWVQNKFSGKQDNKIRSSSASTSYRKQETREEFSDWPQGLLSIGTFGNDNIKEIQKNHNYFVNEEIIINQSSSSSNNNNNNNNDDEEILDNIITLEEVGQLQKELTKLLNRNKPNKSDLPLDRFLNCPSSLEVDRRLINSDDHDIRDEDIDKTIRVIIGKCKEAIYHSNKKKKSLAKKSFSFLLKKIFVCRTAGFAPATSLRDTLPESRMEKLLRTILHKKLSPQHSYRCLEEKNTAKKKEEQEKENGFKWDKTDSEYIVLEI